MNVSFLIAMCLLRVNGSHFGYYLTLLWCVKRVLKKPMNVGTKEGYPSIWVHPFQRNCECSPLLI